MIAALIRDSVRTSLRMGGLCAALAMAGLSAPAALAQAGPNAASSAATATQQLDKLAHEFYEAQARFDPVAAGGNGDTRFDDQIGMAIAPPVRANHYRLIRLWLTRLHTIERRALQPKGQVNYDILDYELSMALRLSAFPSHLMPINQMASMPVTLATYASGQGAQRLVSVEDYKAYLSRLNQLPAWIDQAIANMRAGMKSGVVLPKAVVMSMLPQFQKLAATTAEASIYFTPIKRLPAEFSDADKLELKEHYSRTISTKLNPAAVRLARFLEAEYLPAARSSTGWDALPNGRKWYREAVASQTTTDMQPEEIYTIGQNEVARIQSEFAALGPKMGYHGQPAGLPQWVAAQSKYKPFTSEREIIDGYRKLDDIVKAKLPALFTLMPKTPLDIRLVPEITRATASNHYGRPAADGSRPGVFWAVVIDPRAFDVTDMATLFLHEGRPGHHFHLALQQELGLPNYRKFGRNNAFGEGWALYAETLGRELGMFDQPENYFGHLNDELLRAARLVVDTGLHARGWSREQAIGYLRDTLGYTEAEARAQIERYMVWPGQALGYKIGSLKILQLRAQAQKALGSKFTLPTFHEVVLEDGGVPLSVLESKVNHWIDRAKAP